LGKPGTFPKRKPLDIAAARGFWVTGSLILGGVKFRVSVQLRMKLSGSFDNNADVT
jgi:hypothetical protein